ncbi:carboxylating nicotinate-nucleotide diphosphorylase [Demequina lignilytica]|uniref:Nicotinate-nucleotide pyrophosphorylase [carboxylating] n=1 Tax=Demequina lignilytica TaxID=3051663 RepID=A0AB35MK88_9MICO|nr:carboxylating nicotinate-nucleotide diphosphorylase [Demequina sp. SYSU T0a273]MDN4484219.1 carboxylating nicotinate-nucleotide diphosphorylase [Demequina sp. SYSU T0a273]
MTHPEELPQDAPLDPEALASLVRISLDEDLGPFPGRDVTTQATIPDDAQVAGVVAAREDCVLAGIEAVGETMRQVASRLGLPSPAVALEAADGDRLAAGAVIARLSGPGHVVLIAERTLLNIMSRASGVATHTRRWVDALSGTGARVLDTRKTTPGLRELEKYAVRMGGGVNKRMGLYDCAMVKDNHIVAAGSVAGAIARIRAAYPEVPIQVEVETAAQAAEAIGAGARFLMIDNMPPAGMAALVASVRAGEGGPGGTGKVWLEATGGLTLANVRAVAATGVDFMSVGALTHSSPIVDLGLDLG